MTDVMTPEQRSRCMSRIRGRNTKPELEIRRGLWATGYRYRLHYGLPGKPDVIFVSSKVAVFVDGCFWHSCPEHAIRPKSNARFWAQKLERTKQRDSQVNYELREAGWLVLRFWEHEVKDAPNRVIQRIVDAVAR